MEVEPLAKITQQNVKNFVSKSIVCKFRIPRVLLIFCASSDLFTTCSLESQLESLSYIPQLVSNEINSQLSGDFMTWEIHVMKSPDNFTVGFKLP